MSSQRSRSAALRAYAREGALLLGFLLLLAAAAVSVVLPELGRDPTAEEGSRGSGAGEGATAAQDTAQD